MKNVLRVMCALKCSQNLLELTETLLRIHERFLIKELVYNKVAGFQASVSILPKMEFLHINFSEILSIPLEHLFLGWCFNDCFHNLLLQTVYPFCLLICFLNDWFYLNRILVIKKRSFEKIFNWFKIAGITLRRARGNSPNKKLDLKTLLRILDLKNYF